MSELIELADYRRRVQDIYHDVRAGSPGRETWLRWRSARDDLFRTHSQSAVEPGARGFEGLTYFEYEPRFAVTGRIEPKAAATMELDHSALGATGFDVVGCVRFEIEGRAAALTLYWLSGYGGGIFLPFRDATSGAMTYAGGRYLLDGAKGADLGGDGTTLVLDFNYAYHPSCVHSARWSCPLAPPENQLDLAITAGERLAEEEIRDGRPDGRGGT